MTLLKFLLLLFQAEMDEKRHGKKEKRYIKE
jgi:hypothetical protein